MRTAANRGPASLPGLNSRLVMELDRTRVRELLLAVLLSAVMLAPLLLYVWQSVAWIQTGYRLEKLKAERDRLEEVNHQLRLEKVSLESLARVERVASGQLGLRQPPAGTVVVVDEARLDPVRPSASTGLALAGFGPEPRRPQEQNHAVHSFTR